MTRRMLSAALVASLPFLMGAKGGCAFPDNAPDVEGTWLVDYAGDMEVTVKIGGAVYTRSLPANGGDLTITHEGKPYAFSVPCEKPEVICPSEVWPRTAEIRQQGEISRHHVSVTVPTQECIGKLVAAKKAECGAGTDNPDCTAVCEGEVTTKSATALGDIDDEGRKFRLLLGGHIAGNGVNCALLALSAASADLVTTGSTSAGDWRATAMKNGVVKTAYTGGCLWAGDPNQDGKLDALVVGASLLISVPFTATNGL